MDKNMLMSALIKNGGIDANNAELLANDLVGLKAPFDGFLERWVKNPEDKEDYELEGITISDLMSRAGLNYPAALSSMNWILQEGEKARAFILNNL